VAERLKPGFAQQHVCEQSAAHSYLAVDSPHRELNSFGLKRLTPGEDVLINAVHERTVEVEQECSLLALHPSSEKADQLRAPAPRSTGTDISSIRFLPVAANSPGIRLDGKDFSGAVYDFGSHRRGPAYAAT
jgi:hypothetical protein